MSKFTYQESTTYEDKPCLVIWEGKQIEDIWVVEGFSTMDGLIEEAHCRYTNIEERS